MYKIPYRSIPKGVKSVNKITAKASIKWIRAYLECLFDNREVHIFPNEVKQLNLFLN